MQHINRVRSEADGRARLI